MTPERDGATLVAPVLAIPAATYAADNTPPAVDMRGARRAVLCLSIGVGGITFDATNKIEFLLTHSSDGVTYAPVTDDDVIKDAFAPATIANGIVRALTAAHASGTVQKIGYIGGKTYTKLLADFSGTHGTGTPLSAVWVKHDLELSGAA